MIHKKFKGKSGRDWYVDVDTLDASGNIHVTDPNPSKHSGMRGYGGGTLKFEMEDGTVEEVVGPWHTHGGAFFKDTGILISDLSATQVTLWDGDKVIYEEKEPVLGAFMRGERIAQQLANLWQRPIKVYSKSRGGSSQHTAQPNREPHVMAIRGHGDGAWVN